MSAHSTTDFLTEGQQAGARYRLAAPRRSPLGTAGAQLGRMAGESMEFMDHREYQPGDDLRRLDWAAYARTDKMIVKLYRQEVCPHLDVVLDGSRSMALAGSPKARAALAVTAALCTAAGNAGYTHRAYRTGGGCHPIVGGTEMPMLWQGVAMEADDSPADSFRTLPPAWRPHGMRALVSDLLWLGNPLEVLSALGHRAATVCVIEVLAAADLDPPHQGNVRLVDSEDGTVQETFLDASALARYRANLRRHREAWRRAARQAGAVMVSLVAEELCNDWDLSPLVEGGVLDV